MSWPKYFAVVRSYGDKILNINLMDYQGRTEQLIMLPTPSEGANDRYVPLPQSSQATYYAQGTQVRCTQRIETSDRLICSCESYDEARKIAQMYAERENQ